MLKNQKEGKYKRTTSVCQTKDLSHYTGSKCSLVADVKVPCHTETQGIITAR